MVGICFYFEETDVDVWSGKNLDAWNYACKAAGDIDHIHVVNKTSMELTNPDIDTYKFTTSTELPIFENAAILVTPNERAAGLGVYLWEFSHSVDWYVFGPGAGWGGNPPEGLYVSIPIAGIVDLHSVHIASTVLLHRNWVVNR